MSSAAEAQRTVRRLTLDQALELFTNNNLELRLARSASRQALGVAREARAFPNPVAWVTHEALSANGQTYSESYFNLSQRITLPWLYSARKGETQAIADAALAGVGADSNRIVFDVKRAFVEAAAAESRLDAVRQVRAVFRLAERSGAARFAEGDLSGYDFRRLRIERARYETLEAETAIVLSRARHRLTTALLPNATDTVLAPSDFLEGDSPPVRAADLMQHALTARPELAAVQAQLSAARASRSVGRAERLPELTLTGGYKRQSDGLDGPYFGAELPIPLWDFRGGAIDAAEAGIEAANERESLTNRLVRTDVTNTLTAYESYATRKEQIGNQLLVGTDDLLRIAQVSYDEGEMSLLELLDAANAYHLAQITAVELQAALWVSYFDLERAVGGFPNNMLQPGGGR